MTLSDYIADTASRMRGVTVTVNSTLNTVSITDQHGLDVFMQGDDAAQFIAERDRIYDTTGDLTLDVIESALAEPYAHLHH